MPLPLHEFDSAPVAHFNPRRSDTAPDLPVAGVACFFQDVLSRLVKARQAVVIHQVHSETGIHRIYRVEVDRQPVTVFHPGEGAPMAGFMFESLIAHGCTRVVACGGAGVLDSSIPLGHTIIPTAAVRDEGTSYHYLPPAREVEAPGNAVQVLERTLQRSGVPYRLGKTWTTDGIYRETKERIARRKQEGCITVEMETAAFFAVAHFRGVQFGQLLYGADDVGGEVWNHRDWIKQPEIRERLFWLAAEACLAL